MEAELNSNLFPIISVGMYNSPLSPEQVFSDYEMDSDFRNGDSNYDSEYFWEHFDNQKYLKKMEECVDEFLSREHEANDIRIAIKVGKIYSPRTYNHATDEVELTVEFDKEEVKKYAKDNREDFGEFLKETYSSYDGFMSLTANNYKQWKKDFELEEEQSIGAVLTYIFKDEVLELRRDFEGKVNEEFYGIEFVDMEERELIISYLEDHVQDRYQEGYYPIPPNFLEDLGEVLVKRVVARTVANIEKNNYKIF